jgi:PASTA domain
MKAFSHKGRETMAQIPHVQPGEVIRSGFINGLIDAINGIGTGTVTGIAVPDVFGLTLGVARTMITQPSVNLVLGTALDAFGVLVDPNGSTSAARIVIGQSPPPGTRVPVGSTVNLIVAAQGGTSTQPIGGQVDVTFDSVTPGTITAGAPVTFRYEVASRATVAADFTIVPTIVLASNQTAWQNALEVRDDSDLVLPQQRILINPDQSRFIRIHIPSVPGAPPNAPFTLTVSAVVSGVIAHPDTRSFTVGQATPPEDTSIGLEVINSVPLSALVGTTVRVAPTGVARINCRAELPMAASYDVSIVVISGTNWTAERNTGSTPATIPITAGDLTTPEGTAIRNPDFLIRALAGASAAGEVELRIQRQGQATMRTRRLTLQRI